MYYHSLASHEGVTCETSTTKDDWRRLKDNFVGAATSVDDKKITYYVWFCINFHFMGIKNNSKVCIMLKAQ